METSRESLSFDLFRFKLAAVLFVLCCLNFFLTASSLLSARADPDSGDEALIVLEHKSGNRWMQNTELNIFANSIYDGQLIFAPFSTEVYTFSVQNSSRFSMEYSMKIRDENKDGIPMEFRLKKRGTYIAGDENKWVSSSQLNDGFHRLEKRSEDRYELEWRWLGDKDTLDTSLGVLAVEREVKHMLSFSITAELDEQPSTPAPGLDTGTALYMGLWILIGITALVVLVFLMVHTRKKKDSDC